MRGRRDTPCGDPKGGDGLTNSRHDDNWGLGSERMKNRDKSVAVGEEEGAESMWW